VEVRRFHPLCLVHEVCDMLAHQALDALLTLRLRKLDELLDALHKARVRLAVPARIARLLRRRDNAEARVIPLHHGASSRR
jgi:hypothetical protein